MARKYSKRLSITETRPGEFDYLRAYIGEKKRWKDLPALFRDGAYQLIARNKLTAAQEARARARQEDRPVGPSAVLREASGANSKGRHDP